MVGVRIITLVTILTLILSTVESVKRRKEDVPFKEDVDHAFNVVRSMIDENANNTDKTDLPFIGGLVRLSFHDCIGAGGCDGCINHTLIDNAGLKTYSDKLDKEYDANFRDLMSRADFYMIAAISAIEKSTSDIEDKKFRFTRRRDFKLGRKSCPTSPAENKPNVIANSLWNIDDVLQFFRSNFSYTDNQIVALMGAHSLGRARIENSGIEGRWVKSPSREKGKLLPGSVLSNEYYKTLANRPEWFQKIRSFNGLTKTQWENRKEDIDSVTLRGTPDQPNMLTNSDLCLVSNFTLNNHSTGEIKTSNMTDGCNIAFNSSQSCPVSPTFERVKYYAKDQNRARWVADFSEIFLHMTERNVIDRRALIKYSELKKRPTRFERYLYMMGGPIRGF